MNKISHYTQFVLAAVILCALVCFEASAKDAPILERDLLQKSFTTHTIYSNNRHNAFTGAAAWKGQVLVVFRSAESHTAFDGQIKVFSTRDGENFEEIATLSKEGKDLRDPKIINTGRRLLLYLGAVDAQDTDRCNPETLLYSSTDGIHWKERKLSGLAQGDWLWWIHQDGKQYYGSAYLRESADAPFKATLYKSRNAMDWEPFFSVPEIDANEIALDTDSKGTLYGLVRQEKAPYHPLLLTIPDPKKPGLFKMESLPFTLQGPYLKRMEDGFIIMGRRWDANEPDPFWKNPDQAVRKIEMLWLGDDGKLERLCTLKSGGDCSYTGWAQLPDGRTVISYYSGHEGKYPHVGIYSAVFPAGAIPTKNPAK